MPIEQKKVLSYQEATGVIRYKMTNDYMFRFILQKNQNVLRGLICSLLHLKSEDIKKIEITNPINLSENVVGKEFIMDINIRLNDNKLINLEMQVIDEENWAERSLSYACRAYDNLQKGQEYEEVLPVIHVGFLDFTPFPEVPEFYSKYVMTNVKNNHVYSDKFIIRVVNLEGIELATEEDKTYSIDYWARLFKAKTWEDLKMIAGKNEYLQEAAESLYIANADEIVRQQCRAREDAERKERTYKKRIKEAEEEAKRAREEAERAKEEVERVKEAILKKLVNDLKLTEDEALQYMKDN